MSIIFFHKMLCWCLMVERSAIVKDGRVPSIVAYDVDICDLP